MRIDHNAWYWLNDGSKPVLHAVEAAGHRIIHAYHTDPLFQESSHNYDLPCEGSVHTFARTLMYRTTHVMDHACTRKW